MFKATICSMILLCHVECNFRLTFYFIFWFDLLFNSFAILFDKVFLFKHTANFFESNFT